MRQASNTAPNGWGRSHGAQGGEKPALSKVVYRSRAVRSLSPPELHELTRAAQARNSAEAITGLMVYDNDRFFQWLEGPSDSIDRVMTSIRNDKRHTDIDVLDTDSVEARAFGAWNMKLATPGPVLASWSREVIEPPREIVEDLRQRPDLAPVVLVRLVPQAAPPSLEPIAEEVARIPLKGKTAAILKTVFLSAVLPQLAGAAPDIPVRAAPPASPRAGELAELLVSSDPDAAMELVRELQQAGGGAAPLLATLLEPAARSLGDLWTEDFCTEFDVTLGLCRLQAAARLLAPQPRGGALRAERPVVLVVPEPGELHRLGAALDSGVLSRAGWSPQCGSPLDDQALEDLVSSNWFDVLDLSLSIAFRREHELDRVTRTITAARRASRNGAMVVIVGGRIFRELATAGRDVGADLATSTAFQVDRSILNTISAARTSTVLNLGQVTPTPA
jgi:methanogenic corrinoid protein MtbC1